MEFAAIILIAAATFGICYLVDKGYTRLFRGKAQHSSGHSVRVSKRYGSFGLIFAVMGLAGIFAGLPSGWVMIAGGSIVALTGICLVVYYMTFGIFYDENSFILTTFGKKSVTYCYQDILSQQLYNSQGSIVIELNLAGGRTCMLQTGMEGVYPFLDQAFAGWCRQKGLDPKACTFHDPDNSCWFPRPEVD